MATLQYQVKYENTNIYIPAFRKNFVMEGVLENNCKRSLNLVVDTKQLFVTSDLLDYNLFELVGWLQFILG